MFNGYRERFTSVLRRTKAYGIVWYKVSQETLYYGFIYFAEVLKYKHSRKLNRYTLEARSSMNFLHKKGFLVEYYTFITCLLMRYQYFRPRGLPSLRKFRYFPRLAEGYIDIFNHEACRVLKMLISHEKACD